MALGLANIEWVVVDEADVLFSGFLSNSFHVSYHPLSYWVPDPDFKNLLGLYTRYQFCSWSSIICFTIK